jgi:hypothetical protein
MTTDRNLLFAVLALQADFLDADQFIKVCTLWTTRKQTPLAINSEPAFEADGTTLGGVVASFEDITERKRLEEAWRQASSELAALRHQRPS